MLVFFDDIVVYSTTLEEHVEQSRAVFEILRKEGLYLKRSKCVFGTRQIEYLGHVIGKEGVATDLKKIEDVVN